MEEIAQVYARSVFEVAEDKGRLDEVREQLGQFSEALEDNRELQVFFFSPYFSTEEKVKALDSAVEGADEVVMNFLRLLIEKHRMPVVYRIRRGFDELWEEENQRLPVEITSAVELGEDTVQQIGDRIGERTGREVELTSKVDPAIVGGLVLRVGDRILDASIATRLDTLRKQVART